MNFAEPIGFLLQGDVRIFIDNDARLKVNIGDKLIAGESILTSFD